MFRLTPFRTATCIGRQGYLSPACAATPCRRRSVVSDAVVTARRAIALCAWSRGLVRVRRRGARRLAAAAGSAHASDEHQRLGLVPALGAAVARRSARPPTATLPRAHGRARAARRARTRPSRPRASARRCRRGTTLLEHSRSPAAVATVDLSQQVRGAGHQEQVRMRLAQLTCTRDAVPDVDPVAPRGRRAGPCPASIGGVAAAGPDDAATSFAGLAAGDPRPRPRRSAPTSRRASRERHADVFEAAWTSES